MKSASATAPRSRLGSGGRLSPDLQAFSIDYARYNYYNIGFRTGLNVFLDSDVFDYYSIPMQFTWRTGRMVSAWRRSRDEGYPNNDPYGNGYNGESKPDWGSAFLSTLFAILPSAFEVHTGFTPGMMFGPLSLPPYDGGFLVRHRFRLYFRHRRAAYHPHLAVQSLRRFHLPLLYYG